jgi:hypothetical protein
MPTYVFENTITGEVFEGFMGISEADNYLEDNPHIRKQITAPAIVSSRGGDRTKPDDGFKSVLSRIADANPTSPMADDFGSKDKKSVAVRDSLKRVKKKLGSIMGDTPKHLG